MDSARRAYHQRASTDRGAPVGAVEFAERELAGRISGLVYVLGAGTLALVTVLPGASHVRGDVLLGLAAGALGWGLCQLLAIDWRRVPWWLIHISGLASLGLIAGVVAGTGGAASPAWVYLFLITVPAGYFYRPAVAGAYLAAGVVVIALPLLYDDRAWHGSFVAQLAVAVPAYLALGGATLAGKALMRTVRGGAEDLAAEQGALRRVATAVAGGSPPERFYELVAREAGSLLSAGAAGILRLDGDEEATVMGSWAEQSGGRYVPGALVTVRPGGDIAVALETRRPVRTDDHGAGSAVDRLGYRSSIVAPILVREQVWGVLAATSLHPGGLGDDDERRLTRFGAVLEIAIAGLKDRETLAVQASSDALTGLANLRALRATLAGEAARARRYGTALSVAVLDLDHFKQINDSGGHEAGDAMLVWVATASPRWPVRTTPSLAPAATSSSGCSRRPLGSRPWPRWSAPGG